MCSVCVCVCVCSVAVLFCKRNISAKRHVTLVNFPLKLGGAEIKSQQWKFLSRVSLSKCILIPPPCWITKPRRCLQWPQRNFPDHLPLILITLVNSVITGFYTDASHRPLNRILRLVNKTMISSTTAGHRRWALRGNFPRERREFWMIFDCGNSLRIQWCWFVRWWVTINITHV